MGLAFFRTVAHSTTIPLPLLNVRPAFADASDAFISSAASIRPSTSINTTLPTQAIQSQSFKARSLNMPTSTDKLVFAHFMVGFTLSYGVADWERNIDIAKSKGIDAFALNFGTDSWQSGQISNAYTAASNSGNFKVFLSFDMTAFVCQGSGDANVIRQFISGYNEHPSQLRIDGKMFVSTFSGESCTFGTGDVNQGWLNAVKNDLPPTYFVPAFFVDSGTLSAYSSFDGIFNWNGAWPRGSSDINFDPDQSYINNLGGRSYMAGVSPWFFAHYPGKNFIYRADEWLWAERWEELIQHRNEVSFAQVISWNDYSESHYVGPVDGTQPGSQAWVDGFDHQDWTDLMQYYIAAYKTGSDPLISKDRIFLWGRLYPAGADAPDGVGRPDNWQWTEDYLWAVVLLTSPAQVTLSCGPSIQSFSAGAGLSKFKLPLTASCSVSSHIVRNGLTTLNFAPSGFNFNTNPPSYNFNSFVAASPA
ncbi:unnamed protein product [Somion occarium]